jgi:hypothetical protein
MDPPDPHREMPGVLLLLLLQDHDIINNTVSPFMNSHLSNDKIKMGTPLSHGSTTY